MDAVFVFDRIELSNYQITQGLDLNKDDVQQMLSQVCSGVVAPMPSVTPEGEVECDEVYIMAGHKGSIGNRQLRPVLVFIPTSMTSISLFQNGGMTTKLFVMAEGSMLETKMGMDFMKSMSIRLRAFGHCCAHD